MESDAQNSVWGSGAGLVARSAYDQEVAGLALLSLESEPHNECVRQARITFADV